MIVSNYNTKPNRTDVKKEDQLSILSEINEKNLNTLLAIKLVIHLTV